MCHKCANRPTMSAPCLSCFISGLTPSTPPLPPPPLHARTLQFTLPLRFSALTVHLVTVFMIYFDMNVLVENYAWSILPAGSATPSWTASAPAPPNAPPPPIQSSDFDADKAW